MNHILIKQTVTFAKKLGDKHTAHKICQKVMDHCLFTVKYRGAAHGICNLKHSISKGIPVFFSQWIELRLSLYYKRISKRV